MAKILLVIGDGAEVIDTMVPLYRLGEDHQVVKAAPEIRTYHLVQHHHHPDWDITVETPGYDLDADIAFRDVNPDDYLGLVLPGGRAPEFLRYDEGLLRITRDFFAKQKPVASICHGIEILAAADVIRGRRVTTIPRCRLDAEFSGATYVAESLVVDGNLYCCRYKRECSAWMKAFVAELAAAVDETMLGLGITDIIVLVVYLLGITALGVWMGRLVKTMGDFFMPRRFGKAMMITNAFGTGTASDQAVVVAAATFNHGLSGIWWQWLWLPATPFYWLIAPIMRRFRAVTTADVYSLRFGSSVAVLFSVVGILGLAVKIGLMLKGTGALVESCTAGGIDANLAMLVITVLFVIYGTAGGLAAAIVTDFFQGILTIVFSFILLPFVLHAVGGIAGMRETIQDPAMLSLVVPGDMDSFFVVMFALQALLGIVAQPFIMGVCASGRTEMDGRVGFMVGNIVKRLCTMAWSVTALAAVAWYLQRGVDLTTVTPDHVYGDVARAFLPAAMPGLLGIFLASLLAAVMSSCDAFMISSSGLFTQNIYKPLRPNQPEKHYVTVGRWAALIVVAGGVAFAYWVPDVVSALKIWFKIAPMMGIAFWLGLLWRRTTVAGAWAVTLTGFTVWWLTTHVWFVELLARLPFADWLDLISQSTGSDPALREPWVVVFYTVSSLFAGVVVSLCTTPVDERRLTNFYDLTRTPIAAGEVQDRPCELPAGVAPAARRMLCTAWGLEIPRPSTVSVLGFVAGWIAVAALIFGFMWLVS